MGRKGRGGEASRRVLNGGGDLKGMRKISGAGFLGCKGQREKNGGFQTCPPPASMDSKHKQGAEVFFL